MDNNFNNDIPKYRKKSTAKPPAKAKHKHEYVPCLIEHPWAWWGKPHEREQSKRVLSFRSYCPICGKKASASISNTEKPLKVEDKPQPKSTICKCGERFYGDICPNCGRNVKDL